MSIEATFNITCTINSLTKGFNATTKQPTETWAELAADVPCRLDMAGGGERRVPEKIYTRYTHVLYMGYRTDISEDTQQIVIGSNTYNILRVSNAGGEDNHLEMELEIIE